MSHHVPEFDLDDFCPAPASSTQSRQHKNMPDDDIMELVWHHGQPRVQNQSQRLLRAPSPPSRPPQTTASTSGHLFMQEDEMTSWLHYPLDDVTSFDQNITDLLYQPPPAGPSTTTLPPPPPSIRALPPPELKPQPLLPPQPQRTRPQLRPPPAQPSAAAGVNFPQFARMKAKVVPESGQSAASSTTTTTNNDDNNVVVVAVQRESTVVDSSDTLKSRSLQPLGGRGGSVSLDAGCSESDGSATPTADLVAHAPSSHDRKRKGVESAHAFTNDNQSEDLDIDQSYETKKPCRGTSAKRSRATEVHNLSERKRRDKINEKMKALQELIPRCTKTDKASMLDEAIEYMKSLQMQLQMMSMGYYGMVPMMFPGVQQYMPMGMGVDMGMTRPMVPFPMQTPRAPSPMGPRFQFPAYQTPPIPAFHPPQAQTNQMESVGNLNCPSDANVYQQYLSAQQIISQPISENPPPNSTPSTSKASTSKEAEDHENHPSSTDMHYNRSK